MSGKRADCPDCGMSNGWAGLGRCDYEQFSHFFKQGDAVGKHDEKEGNREEP